MTDTAALRRKINDELFVAHDDEHEHDRSLARTSMVFELFYDDEATEPAQAITDALTDLMHAADARSLDFISALERASWRHQQERTEWKASR